MLVFMTDIDDAIVLDDASLSLVEELQATRDSIKTLKAREDEIRKSLLGKLTGHGYGITASGAPVIEVERYTRTRVDSQKLQALYEDVWEDCQTGTAVEVLRFPEPQTA